MAKEKQTPERNWNDFSWDREKRYWKVPKNRAKTYAEELKNKVHIQGKHEGQELTAKQAGLRSGYLQCQSDHAGTHKYKKALAEGKTKDEAARIAAEKKKR